MADHFELPPIEAYEDDGAGEVVQFPARSSAGPATPLGTLDLSTVPLDDVPPRQWIVPDIIPDRNVTDLSGDGGLGKSLLALQLGVAMTAARDWIGLMPEPGPFLYVSCEDEPDEILRRRNAVFAGMGLSPASLQGFHLLDLTSADASELAGPGKLAAIELTELHRRAEATIKTLRPKCIVLDTRADVFGGNELSRVQVRFFVRALRKLCIQYDCAIVLLSHPSVSGMASGSGQSGSTAWGNSVRSRLYLTAPKAEGDGEIDPDIRVLSNRKANYGPRGSEIILRYDRGMFRPDGGALVGLEREVQEKMVERRFMELVREIETQGRKVNASSGPNYAPKAFARIDGKFTAKKYRTAMESLFAKKMIVNASDGRSTRVELTPAGLAEIHVPF